MNKAILMLLTLLLPCTALATGATYYLKIDPIKGESKRADHEDEIDVRSWSWGASADGRVTCIDDLEVYKYVDLSSADLLMGQIQGTVYPEAILSARKDSGDSSFDFLVITFANVQITSVSTDGDGGDGGLKEKVTLQFQSAKYEYTALSEDGSEAATNSADIVPGVRCR
ncbi:MAG: type VI secretion system tube protein Hcp [Gammaproteobacteria bacterium]|jgi:type VI secretion system secreted protein Hcp